MRFALILYVVRNSLKEIVIKIGCRKCINILHLLVLVGLVQNDSPDDGAHDSPHHQCQPDLSSVVQSLLQTDTDHSAECFNHHCYQPLCRLNKQTTSFNLSSLGLQRLQVYSHKKVIYILYKRWYRPNVGSVDFVEKES